MYFCFFSFFLPFSPAPAFLFPTLLVNALPFPETVGGAALTLLPGAQDKASLTVLVGNSQARFRFSRAESAEALAFLLSGTVGLCSRESLRVRSGIAALCLFLMGAGGWNGEAAILGENARKM